MTKIKDIKPTGEQQVIEQFKVKKQNITILLKQAVDFNEEENKWEAKEESYSDIKGYQLSGPYLVIQQHDDTQYVYPMSEVAKLTLTVSEE